jgi:hypothetical protein
MRYNPTGESIRPWLVANGERIGHLGMRVVDVAAQRGWEAGWNREGAQGGVWEADGAGRLGPRRPGDARGHCPREQEGRRTGDGFGGEASFHELSQADGALGRGMTWIRTSVA